MANLYKKQCETCGKTFEGTKSKKFCCDKCLRISTKFRRNNKVETKEINKNTYHYLFGANKDAFLNKCIKNAEEIGISYGLYMAWRYMGIIKTEV